MVTPGNICRPVYAETGESDLGSTVGLVDGIYSSTPGSLGKGKCQPEQGWIKVFLKTKRNIQILVASKVLGHVYQKFRGSDKLLYFWDDFLTFWCCSIDGLSKLSKHSLIHIFFGVGVRNPCPSLLQFRPCKARIIPWATTSVICPTATPAVDPLAVLNVAR